MPEAFESPLTELAAMAAMHHELYTAEIEAGFTDEQAMRIILAVITAGAGGGQ